MSVNVALTERLKITQYDHDPANSTVATDVAWVDMLGYTRILIGCFASALTGTGASGAGAFKILANQQSNGGGSDVTVVTHATVTPDAVGDHIWAEASWDDIVAAGRAAGIDNLRYVSANLTLANAADEQVVTYIREAQNGAAGNTADVIAE